MPIGALRKTLEKLFETGIETLERPRWAMGHFVAGDIKKAISTLWTPKPEAASVAENIGIKNSLARMLVDLATDPIVWALPIGAGKLPVQKAFVESPFVYEKVASKIPLALAGKLPKAGRVVSKATIGKIAEAAKKYGVSQDAVKMTARVKKLTELTESGGRKLLSEMGDLFDYSRMKLGAGAPIRSVEQVLGRSKSMRRVGEILQEAERRTGRLNDMYSKQVFGKILKGIKPGSASDEKIFRWLNPLPDIRVTGLAAADIAKANAIRAGLKLNPVELKAAQGMQKFFNQIAVRLGLAKNQQIAYYAPHIFRRQIVKGAMIRETAPQKAWMSFLLKRKGAKGYELSIMEAMRQYIPQATRKIFYDPAFEKVKILLPIGKIPNELRVYVYERLMPRLYGRPSAQAGRIATTLSGIKPIKDWIAKRGASGPITAKGIERQVRNITGLVYNAVLGFNPGPAIKNFTQHLNTTGEIGLGWWRHGLKTGKTKAGLKLWKASGLERGGPLLYIDQPRLLGVWGKWNRASMAMFQKIEGINRRTAFLGAYGKGIKDGLKASDAFRYAIDVVKRTQFFYGRTSMPLAIQTPVGRMVGQLLTFPLKQTEMWAGWVKSKNYSALGRYAALTGWTAYVAKKVFGADFSNVFGAGIYPTGLTPIPKLAYDISRGDTKALKRDLQTIIPAGVQAKKVKRFIDAARSGWQIKGPRGRLQYPSTQADELRRLVGVLPVSAGERRRFFEEAKALKTEYYNARNKIIDLLLDEKVTEALGLLMKYNTTHDEPIIITGQDLTAASKMRGMTAQERFLRTVPKPVKKMLKKAS